MRSTCAPEGTCSRRARSRWPCAPCSATAGPTHAGGTDPNALLVHERLASVDPAGDTQPLHSADNRLALSVNREICNHRDLRARLEADWGSRSGFGREIANALYRDGADVGRWLDPINGLYALALWGCAAQRVMVTRDPLDACPL